MTKLRPLKFYASLAKSRVRRRENLFLAEGENAVSAFLAGPDAVAEILTTRENAPSWQRYRAAVRVLTQEQMNKICSAAGAISVAALVDAGNVYADELPRSCGDAVLFLEDIQDPGNMGTLIRSAAAFGFSGVIVTESGADPLSPKVIRSTAGGASQLWIRRVSSPYEMLPVLQKKGYTLITLDLDGAAELPPAEKTVLCVGNEGSGISAVLKKLAEAVYTIPFQSDRVESLNAAVAGAVAMSHFYHKKHVAISGESGIIGKK
ncbi:MAG: TrmH family RNA methyltransferase [Fibrobacterota bacterium]